MDGRVFDPGSNWHVYRVEVKGNTVQFYIDENAMASAQDNKYLVAGDVGLWCNQYKIEVRSFTVIAL